MEQVSLMDSAMAGEQSKRTCLPLFSLIDGADIVLDLLR
jgi:hypothetical protein